MFRYLLALCLVLSSGNYCMGQQSPASNALSTNQKADAILNDLLDQINSIDEPTVRILLRHKTATYLWSAPIGSVNPEVLAVQALTDLEDHQKEIPSRYVKLFSKELMAQLYIYAPKTATSLIEKYKLRQSETFDLELAYALLNTKGGTDVAVNVVRNSIAHGQGLGDIFPFILLQLEKQRPPEVPKILSDIMIMEEQRPGTLTIESLSFLKHYYLRDETRLSLQNRYLNVVVNTVRQSLVKYESGPSSDAYRLLAATLPTIQKQQPSVYGQASELFGRLAERTPRGIPERIEIDNRIKQSDNSLSELFAEAQSAKDEKLKKDLLTRAAQLARDQGQLRTAVDLVTRLQAETEEEEVWRDQFLENIVNISLNKTDTNLEDATYASLKIGSTLIRASALEKMALHLFKLGDIAGARRVLNNAYSLIKTSDDNIDKAKALFRIVLSFSKVDEERAPELIQQSVDIVNRLFPSKRDREVDHPAPSTSVNDLMDVTYSIIPVFQSLAVKDDLLARGMANTLQRNEFKASATFGASVGILLRWEADNERNNSARETGIQLTTRNKN